MKHVRNALITIAVLVALFAAIWCIGRYGWKLRGFDSLQSATIEAVEVTEGQVRITGVCPGLVPKGFLGYKAKEEKGRLFVGYKFSAVFGIFETGRFDITIPTKGTIDRVYTRTGAGDVLLWERK